MLKRLTTIAVIGTFAGLSLASPASANFEPGPGVTFGGGGLGLLLCGSKPDTPRITVGAESKVRLTNALGMAAQLNIDGANSAAVGSGETVEVQFHRGPVSITMVPDCALNLNPKFEQLTVDVTVPQAVVPARPVTPATTPAVKPSTAAPSTPGDPAAGLPPLPGDPLFPDQLGNVSASGTPGPDGVTLHPSATVVNPDGSPAQKLASERGPIDKGPIGLLAIIATVCVVGVSAGAIRAIITQRATRAFA